MALRREKIKQVMQPVAESFLQSGERQRAACLVMRGPSPWWLSLVGNLLWFWIRYYYVAVTDRRVLFIRTTMVWGIRPKGVEFADPLSPDTIVEYHPGRVWSVIKYRRSDGSALRLNVHRIWRAERDELVSALRQPAAASDQTAATPPATPPVPPPPPA